MPVGLASSDLANDRVSLGLIGAAVLGALLMAIVLATQAGGLPSAFAQHLNAAGQPDRWGSPRTLWRLPLIAVGTTVMNGVLAWFLAPRDRFAARFVLAAALVVQLVAWVALFDFL
jgi:hypothetical protein